MSRQRKWALAAHGRVKARKAADSLITSYATHCKKGPSLLQRAGTMQALAFLRSRKESSDAGRQYADDLAAICREGKDGDWLLGRAQGAGLEEYLVLSGELLSISTWLRRFAQIELGESEPADG